MNRGRLMVLMTFNTDIADTWEQEAASPDYFDDFAPEGYSFGLNVLFYAVTE